MNHTLGGVVCLVVALLATIPNANGSVSTKGSGLVEAQPRPRTQAFLIDARLRSAFIQRLTGLQFSPPSATADERSQELQRHFDAVLELLEANRARSVDLALQRLEKSRGENWDARTRLTWQKRLEQERQTNVDRLERYRDRGLFPINEHVAGQAVPVFVDNYDTACAVGHLMRLSGWEQEVAAIQAARNLVYVNDVAAGPLVDWVATSGLTQEEAALIQPAYEPPLADATLQELMSGGSIASNGVRYENFQILAGSQLFWPGQPLNSVIAIPFSPTITGASAHDEVYESPSGPSMTGQFEDWLFVGALDQFGGPFSSAIAEAPANGTHRLGFSFEVVAEQPGALIDAATLESIAIFNFNIPNQGDIRIRSLIADPSVPGTLVTLTIESDQNVAYFLSDKDAGSFAPKERIRVTTYVDLQNGATFTSLTYSFNAIPEPTTASLGILGCAALIRRGARNRTGGLRQATNTAS